MSNRAFTEAVPLSLSSSAHMTMPLEDGVVDGLKQVLQHTLLSCVNYARAIHPPYNWSFRDLTTSKYAWEAHEGQEPPVRDLPSSLAKNGFKHQYHRTAFIYLKPKWNPETTQQQELEYYNQNDWSQQESILGRVSLLYATTALMTKEELNGTERDDDTPKCHLYKVVVEYRSLPATGKKVAVQAEELSMLSFGGSVDDDVKYGALASLYDPHAKYILEIYSVRGKKYKFDLMDSTLSDGTVPRLPIRSGATTEEEEDNEKESKKLHSDPFLKSLCVTVTDHHTSTSSNDDNNNNNNNGGTEAKNFAVTRMHLTMEGNLRCKLDDVPEPHYVAKEIQSTFLSLNHSPTEMVTSTPSGFTLLLDPSEAGKVYINGRFVTTWGSDPRIGSHFPALFGMDLHSIPYWHGRIFDFDVLKRQYAQLWQEVLIDARLMGINVGGKLLSRLINGRDPVKGEEDDDDDDDDDDDIDLDEDDDEEEEDEDEKPRINTDLPCLESQVMESSKYDPVGISAKALATRFKIMYGDDAYPCLAHEIDWVKDRLPGSDPIVVPQRVINVLKRGGYFDIKRTSDEVWFSESRPAKEGSDEQLVVDKAVTLLKECGCNDVTPNIIVFFSGSGISNPMQKKGFVRYNRSLRQYHVNEQFMQIDLTTLDDEKMSTDEEEDAKGDVATLGFLLGVHIAQEHPDGSVLLRYLLKHRQSS